MAPHPPAVDTLAPPPQATGGRRLSILIFDPSEHHRPEFKVQDDSPGKLSLQWHLAVEIATVVCATAVYVLQVPIDIKFENQEIYDTAFVIEKYTDIAKWFEFKNTKVVEFI